MWKRLEQIYKWHAVPENLAAAHGTGTLTGKDPPGSHCNNIGRVHRESMAPALKKWLRLDAPEVDAKRRFKSEDLRCLIGDAAKEYSPANVFKAFEKVATRPVSTRPESPLQRWDALLGIEPLKDSPATMTHGPAKSVAETHEFVGPLLVESIILETGSKIHIPVLILSPKAAGGRPLPLAVAVAQDGKGAFLKHRAADIAALVKADIAVALVDLRGTGETRPGDGRGRSSAATALSAGDLMLGRTTLGSRVKDLRMVLARLRQQKRGSRPIGLWGDSFAEPNSADDLAAPLDAEKPPRLAEPLGALAVMFAGLADETVIVYARGGLSSYADAVKQPYLYLPHDVIVPGAAVGPSLESVRTVLGKRAVFVDTVDAQNRLVHRGTEKPAEWLISRLAPPNR